MLENVGNFLLDVMLDSHGDSKKYLRCGETQQGFAQQNAKQMIHGYIFINKALP